MNTGASLQKFNLRVLEHLMGTSSWLVANENSMENGWKKRKIEDLAILLEGARLAKDRVGLMLHASNKMMEKVFEVLPSMRKPTVTQLRGENWFDVLTVAEKKSIREVIPKLKKIGCTDIVEFPLDKVIL
jgi:ATP phosphoribosyltransferase